MKKKVLIIMLLIILGTAILGKSFVYAVNPHKERNQEQTVYRYYKSIQIKEGDNLWSLAKEYNENSNLSLDGYVRVLRSINGLTKDTIHEGQYLTIVYFSDEYK